jgi:hypothetical protein
VTEGILVLRDERDARFQRLVRKARFLHPGNRAVDVFPPLVDAQLLHADENQQLLFVAPRTSLVFT